MAGLSRHDPGRVRRPPFLGSADALEAPPTLAELRDYRRGAGVPWYRGVAVIGIGSLLGAALVVCAAILLARAIDPVGLPPAARLALLLVPLSWTLLILGGFAWWLRWRLRDVRLRRFARANGLGFVDRAASGTLDWRVARTGLGFPKDMVNVERAAVLADGIVLARNQPVAKPGGGSGFRRPFAFAQLALPSEVPHIVLKNRRSRVLALAGLGLGNRAVLSLEGDFDRYFTLFCPAGYERDALEIFTPDVMAALIDVANDCEVELVDDRLLLYFRFGLPLWKPETMDRVQAALALLRDRFARQTIGYRDERAAHPPGVAAGSGAASASGRGIALAGRRTTSGTGMPAAAVVATAAVLLLSAVVTALSVLVLPQL